MGEGAPVRARKGVGRGIAPGHATFQTRGHATKVIFPPGGAGGWGVGGGLGMGVRRHGMEGGHPTKAYQRERPEQRAPRRGARGRRDKARTGQGCGGKGPRQGR